MTKAEILAEIRRAAAEHGGAAPGMRTFERQTGIRAGDWLGMHWRSWGDASERLDSPQTRSLAELTRKNCCVGIVCLLVNWAIFPQRATSRSRNEPTLAFRRQTR